MKQSISGKELTLLAGILVALIVAFMLMSTSTNFSAEIPGISIPRFELPMVAKVVVQKIGSIF